MILKFNPGTGEEFHPPTAEEFRKENTKTAWLFNPWTGARRDAVAVGRDVYGYSLVKPTQTFEQDQEVLVKDRPDSQWVLRKFAKQCEDRFFTYHKGQDSSGDSKVQRWECIRPVPPADKGERNTLAQARVSGLYGSGVDSDKTT